MKNLLLVVFVALSSCLFAQRDLSPGKRRSDTFGKADFKNYRYCGLQLSAGPTFMKTRSDANNNTYSTTDLLGRPMDYTYDPAGKVGFFAEVGLAHFPKKRGKLSLLLKTVLVSYYDWGIGFKYLGGKESTTINYYNALGNLSLTETGKGDYYNGYLYGRFTLHKNINLSKKFFIDNGLGVNVDFRLINGNKEYNGATISQGQSFHKPLVAQLHYGLGFGIKMSRRCYVIPGVQLPILGINEWRKGCAALKWFNSNYLPIQAQVKFIWLFEKRVKGCNTPGSEEDKKRNEEYLQNN
ncbi:MAG: hypothetical protein RI883_1236 [Bacteroidota bacterium]|jgi:hypothetical protein